MPMRCLVCKAEVSTTCKRSFHRFPKDDSMKQKWLDAINVSKPPNFNTALICSDHFDTKSFCDADEARQRKRLYKEAVPNLKNINAQNLLIKNEIKETAIIGVNHYEGINISKDISLQEEMCTEEITPTNSLKFYERNVPEVVSLQSHLSREVEICTNTVPSITSIKSQDIDVSKDVSLPLSTEKVTETSTQKLLLNNSETLSGSFSGSKSNSRKRKHSFNDIRTVKRLRFMNGFKTEYVCREDFVSEESWNRFLRYAAYHRSTSVAASRRNSRKQKKIKNLTAVIENLNKREQFDAAEYLKVIF